MVLNVTNVTNFKISFIKIKPIKISSKYPSSCILPQITCDDLIQVCYKEWLYTCRSCQYNCNYFRPGAGESLNNYQFSKDNYTNQRVV